MTFSHHSMMASLFAVLSAKYLIKITQNCQRENVDRYAMCFRAVAGANQWRRASTFDIILWLTYSSTETWTGGVIRIIVSSVNSYIWYNSTASKFDHRWVRSHYQTGIAGECRNGTIRRLAARSTGDRGGDSARIINDSKHLLVIRTALGLRARPLLYS